MTETKKKFDTAGEQKNRFKDKDMFKPIKLILTICIFLICLSGCADEKSKAIVNPMGLSTKYEAEAEKAFALADVLWKNTETCSDPELAIKYLNKAVSIEPDYAEAYIRRGMAFGQIGDFDMAEHDLLKAIKLNPNAQAYTARALIFMHMENYKGAQKDLEWAIETNPNYNKSWLYLGDLQKKLQNAEAACKNYAEACSKGDCSRIDMEKESGYCPKKYFWLF